MTIKVLKYLSSLVHDKSDMSQTKSYTIFIKDPKLELKNTVDEWLIFNKDKEWEKKVNKKQE